jgi:dTDP-4-amino-4,6-dideoxygalactose transaminase
MKLALGLREWGVAEWAAGLRGAAGLVDAGAAERAVAEWFEQAYGRPALVLNRARSALILALRHLQAQAPAGRDEVVLPALGCPALTLAVAACGLRPVYADIGDDLNTPAGNVQACLAPRTLAVVMVHAYGLAADSAALASLCRDAQVALIDDAAQRVEPASTLGTAGAFGVFSFAQSKSVVTGIHGAGGVLLVNDREALDALRARVAVLPRARHRLRPWLEFAAMPHAPRLTYYLGRWRAAAPGDAAAPAHIGALDAAVAACQLATLPQRMARRRAQLLAYDAALQDAGVWLPQRRGLLAGEYLARLMVRLPAAQREAARQALAAAGITTRMPYPLQAGVDESSHPRAWRASRELLELPLPRRLTAAEAGRVAEVLRPHVTASASPTSRKTEA